MLFSVAPPATDPLERYLHGRALMIWACTSLDVWADRLDDLLKCRRMMARYGNQDYDKISQWPASELRREVRGISELVEEEIKASGGLL